MKKNPLLTGWLQGLVADRMNGFRLAVVCGFFCHSTSSCECAAVYAAAAFITYTRSMLNVRSPQLVAVGRSVCMPASIRFQVSGSFQSVAIQRLPRSVRSRRRVLCRGNGCKFHSFPSVAIAATLVLNPTFEPGFSAESNWKK